MPRRPALRHVAPRRPAVGWLVCGSLCLALLSACSGGSTPAGLISISTGGCGGSWHLAAPGWHTFRIYNGSTGAAEVDLINPANGAIYAEVEAVGPGTSEPMPVDVGSGSYAFRCLIEDTDPITGPAVRVGGHARGATAILPVTQDGLIGPAQQYHAYVTAGLNTLVAQVGTLTAAIRSGNLAAARAAWLPAHLTYERLGAAYGTFGNYDAEIDGRADGLPRGVNDPGWTGFYRLEYGLWHGPGTPALNGLAARLDGDVRALRAAWPGMEIDLLGLGLRTHEILENALEFQLTGHDDYGSGTTLGTTDANVQGTLELLTVLHPLLAARYPALPVYTWLGRLQSLLNGARSGGAWTPAAALSTTSREQINAAASQALEELAPIAVITEPRRT
jgi:iron uptake system component EfeO